MLNGALIGGLVGSVLCLFLFLYAKSLKPEPYLKRTASETDSVRTKLTPEEAIAKLETIQLGKYKRVAQDTASGSFVFETSTNLVTFGFFHSVRVFTGSYNVTMIQVSHFCKVPQYGPVVTSSRRAFLAKISKHLS